MILLGLNQPPVEVRSTSYTDQIITAAESAASIGTVRSSSLSVLESCAGLIARSLAAAYVRPGTAAVTPAFLHQVGGDLVRRGESVHVLSISDRGTVAWWPAADWDVTGEPDPETWLYRVRLAGPSMTISRTVPRAGVCHFRWSAHPLQPWKGVGPIQLASSTSRLAAAIERSLSDEFAIPALKIIDAPFTSSKESAKKFGESVGLPGPSRVLIPTATGRTTDRSHDWKVHGLRPTVTETDVELRRDIEASIASSCGVSPILLNPGAAGPAILRARQQLHDLTVDPLAKIIASELARVLEHDVDLAFRPVDRVSASRALKGLTDAGMKVEEATARVF